MEDKGKISDGYHTFDELYEHRIVLWIKLCELHTARYHNVSDEAAWRSKLHSDGSSYDGWFILGLREAHGEQMTYHLPLSKWEECDFAVERDRAPEFDGHSSTDVLKRIAQL